MITAAEIQKRLEDFSETKIGKKRVQEELKKNKQILAKKIVLYDEAVSTLARIINEHTPDSIKNALPVESIMRGASKPVENPDGTYTIHINFDKNLLRRDSLAYDGNGDFYGAYDIVGLFTKGWDTDPSKRVWGTWHGKDHVLNKLHKESDRFVQDAINEFMVGYAEKYGVIDCIIDNKYIGNK